MAWSVVAGFILAVVISLAAWRVKALNPQGALAATLLGTIIFGLGGLGWAFLLLVFFISSSALSRLFRKRKAVVEEQFSKGSRRDAAQVCANGGIAGLFVLLHVAFPTALWPWVGCAGALAAANADTWATEIGVLSRSAPRSIVTGKPVKRGESGGISLPGTLAAAGGAFIIALLAVLFWQGHVLGLPQAPGWLSYTMGSGAAALTPPQGLAWLAWITLAGLAGSLVDSLLGATVQALYTCPSCRKLTERHPLHACGTATVRLRGWPWLNNDWVNLFCTLAGALVSLLRVALLA